MPSTDITNCTRECEGMSKYSVGDVVKVVIECKAIVKDVKYTPICYPSPTRLEIKDNYSYKCKIKNEAIDETQFLDWNDVEIIGLWDENYDEVIRRINNVR